MTKGNDFAYPRAGTQYASPEKGTTKRELFAAMAMYGLLSSWGNHDATTYEEIAMDAVSAADKLITALNEKQDGE